MLGTSKSIWGFTPQSVPGCTLWLDASDRSTMNSTTTVTQWNDKSGQSNNVTGTATLSGSNMTFDGSTQAFSNLTYVFPYAAYSLFAVYSNTAVATSYMNVMYGSNGYPMLGVDLNKSVTALPVAPTVTMWATRIAGTTTSSDIGYGVATDSSGNVFVTGPYSAALTLYNSSGVSNASLAFTGGTDVFLAKYSSTGTVLWAAQITGTTTSEDLGQGLATDSSGNVFVTGYYGAALTLSNATSGGGTGATLAFTGVTDVFLAKYSSTGSVLWAAQIAGTGSDIGYGVATDPSGNVVVTGYYSAALSLSNAV